jgi:heat shock protein HslJ
LEGEWRLAVLRDAPSGIAIAATLKIDSAQASGAAGCRAWTAGALRFGADLRFADLTEGANPCAQSEAQLERKVLDVVTATRSARIRDGYLILIDETGRERAYFKRPA